MHCIVSLYHRYKDFGACTKLTSAKINQNKAQIQSEQTVSKSLLCQKFNWHNARVQKKETLRIPVVCSAIFI